MPTNRLTDAPTTQQIVLMGSLLTLTLIHASRNVLRLDNLAKIQRKLARLPAQQAMVTPSQGSVQKNAQQTPIFWKIGRNAQLIVGAMDYTRTSKVTVQ